MSNKDLGKQLAAMRLKAKREASAEAVAAPPAQAEAPAAIAPPAQETRKEKPAKVREVPKLKVLSSKKGEAPRQGRGGKAGKAAAPAPSPELALERTTITLKTGDNAAISDLQVFLMKRVRKAASTSTLIRLALFYTKEALASNAEEVASAYQQILRGDGRRKAVANV